MDFATREVNMKACDGDIKYPVICQRSLTAEEIAETEAAKEEKTVYAGSQLEFCLLTVQVCYRKSSHKSC